MCGTPEQAILDHEKLNKLAGGVREGQNLLQKWSKFGFRALQWPLDGLQTPEMDTNQSGAIYSIILGLFRGLWKALKPNLCNF